jgi:hypothetical protein
MKGKLMVSIFFLILIGIIYIIYKISTFSLFDVKRIKVTEIEVPYKPYKIEVFYTPSNATAQSSIQIMQITNGNESLLKFYERYNYLKEYSVINDTVSLILSDTAFKERGADTLLFKLP